MAFQLVTLANGLNQYVNVAGGLVPRGAYDPLVSYVIGDMVDYSGSSYVMYNLGPAGTVPTDATYWGLVAQKGNPGSLADFVGNWTSATNYTPDECVTHNGSSYYCTAPNLAGATNEPGVGVDWNLYWQLSAQAGAPGAPGANGVGVPVGGTEGQLLAKVDGTNYNTTWIDNTTAQIEQTVKLAENINKGQAVYVSGASGSNIEVSKADNTSDSTSATTLGLLKSTGVTNDQRVVVTEGLIDGVDTNAAGAAGDPVWLGTNGNLLYGVVNKPSAPAHLVFIGTVVRKSATVGEIFVHVQNGWELDELHNVDINSPTNGQILSYDGVTSLWTNTAPPASSDSRINTPIGTNSIYVAETALSFTGTSSVALGLNAAYLGTGSTGLTAIGNYAVANGGNYTTAIGYSAGNYAGTNNIFIGNESGMYPSYNTRGDYCINIGDQTGQNTTSPANPRIYGSIAVGRQARAGDQGTAIGLAARSGYNSIALGPVADASASTEATAIGFTATASNQFSVAMGHAVQSRGVASVAIGNTISTNASAPYTVTIGNNNTTDNPYGIIIGSDTTNTGKSHTISLGYNVTNATTYGIAIGSSADTRATTGGADQSTIAIGTSSKSNGEKNVAIGYLANNIAGSAESVYGVALGARTKLRAGYAVAVGSYADANDNATAVGYASTAAGVLSTAVGVASSANGYASTALGTYATPGGAYSVSIGYQANGGTYTVNVGSNIQNGTDESVSVGYGTTINSQYTTSVGYSATITNTSAYATAIGHSVKGNGLENVSIGYLANNVSGAQKSDRGVVIGARARLTSDYGVAVGAYADAGNNATAVGYGAIASGLTAASIGVGATASNTAALSGGYIAQANGNSSIAFGVNAGAIAQSSIAIGGIYGGLSSYASANYTVALGAAASATALYSVTIGGWANSSGESSIAIGSTANSGASATGAHSIAIGRTASATAAGSVAIGADSTGASASATSSNQFVLGTSSHTVEVPGKLYVADKVYGSVDISAAGSTTQAVNIDKGSFRITSLDKDITLSNPTGTPKDMQRFVILINADGTLRNLTWSSDYRDGATVLPATVGANETVICEFIYNGAKTKWDLLSANTGIS